MPHSRSSVVGVTRTNGSPRTKIAWTDEQEAIFACSAPVVVIKALAGTGKTSTLREYARRRPHERFLYLVYNKAAQLEAKDTFPENVEVRTMHSVAYGDLPRSARWKVGDVFPVDIANRFGVSQEQATKIIELLNRFFGIESARIEEAATRHDSNLIIGAAARAWKEMNDERSGLRLPHDGYLKRFMLRNVALTQWDTLLVDEFQDANPATAVIVKRQNHMRRIVVGDNNQSIYGFRGAVDAMNFLSGEQRTLTQSFRFGASVARAANAVLAQKGETLEVVGRGGPSQVLFCSAPREVMLLAQTNAQAIQAAAERDGEPVWFAGGLTAYRVKRIEDAYLLSRHLWNKVSDYEMRHFRSLNGLEAYARETQSVELMAICGFVRTYGDEVPRMMEDLRQRAVDRVEDARFWVSTAHKAKGLEFPHVALGGFFDWEEYVAQRERRFTREMVEDLNLLYVAATRAINTLYADETLARAIAEYEGVSYEELTGLGATPVAPQYASLSNSPSESLR
ncbi:MAG: UvrD-helicase domain-containing protein [Methylobacteriaceae bacterium]|nr:UvrD-helicase domain-containing protein [Methylobacteriaceae bacterium]